jgi:hypothetical protein
MIADCLSPPISLHRPRALRAFDAIVEHSLALHRRLKVWRAERAQYRRALQAERELAHLSPRTLQDIGAPMGLVGQRRWQEEHEAAQLDRLLNQRGW